MPQLYCADTLQLLAQQQQLSVTRVPVTLGRGKAGRGNQGAQPLTTLGNGYHGRWQTHRICRGRGVWLLVRSEQTATASSRRGKNLLKDIARELKAFAKLLCPTFVCEADAR